MLVEVRFPDEKSRHAARINLNEMEVTAAFHSSADSPLSLVGLVTGLKLGRNELEVVAGKKSLAKLAVTNHPLSGPVISGPHQQPFVCQTEAAGLGPPTDSNCRAPTQVKYFYFSSDTQAFKPLNVDTARPTDADFIVRKEMGTINRAIYEISFPHEPGKPLPTPWNSAGNWNGRLVYTFGGGCSAGYRQSAATAGVMNAAFLKRGFAVASSTQNVFANNCNDVLSAETLMMVKEHFIEQFGVPRHSIGWGSSGGSMQQHLISQNYPGLLDGILPGTSFPDIMTTAQGALDCSLLANSLEKSSEKWSEDQKTAISGFSSWGMCALRERGKLTWIPSGFTPGWLNPARCDAIVPKAAIYNASTNPNGIRCTLYDNNVNELGKDTATGFAHRLLDNVGVQYGLVAFQEGKISAEQFVQLNEKAGGFDSQAQLVGTRNAADPAAVATAYRRGRVNTGGGGLPATAIIDLRTYVDLRPDLHDRFRSFSTRARLRAANGNADNQVMFTVPPIGGPFYDFNDPKAPYNIHGVEALELMNRWLDNIDQDHRPGTRAQKVARNKPAGLVDTCWSESGERIVDGPAGKCRQLYPYFGDPRTAAGSPIANDVLKCTLKPIDARQYSQHLSEEQLARLKSIFPSGACDYSRQGVGQQTIQEVWKRYE